MSREGDSTPARKARMRNTVRIELLKGGPADVRERFRWDFVVVKLLREWCGIAPSEIYCLQDFAASGFFDLTLFSYAACLSFYNRCWRRRGEEVMRGLRLVPCFHADEVTVSVHLYNPHVEDEVIRAFLERYCSEVSACERVKGSFGVWTGRRRFRVRLRRDPARPGEFVHPPGSFSIGPHRGFLHYSGQPEYCRRCGQLGHSKEICTGLVCRFCGSPEHKAAACRAPKECNLCGERSHLYRACPTRKTSFAALFRDEVPEQEHAAGPSNERAAAAVPPTGGKVSPAPKPGPKSEEGERSGAPPGPSVVVQAGPTPRSSSSEESPGPSHLPGPRTSSEESDLYPEVTEEEEEPRASPRTRPSRDWAEAMEDMDPFPVQEGTVGAEWAGLVKGQAKEGILDQQDALSDAAVSHPAEEAEGSEEERGLKRSRKPRELALLSPGAVVETPRGAQPPLQVEEGSESGESDSGEGEWTEARRVKGKRKKKKKKNGKPEMPGQGI